MINRYTKLLENQQKKGQIFEKKNSKTYILIQKKQNKI